jgi:hypothetical protein
MIQLNEQQQAAKDQFMSFLSDTDATDFVLEGFAGTGKSTLVSVLLDESPKMLAAIQLITQEHREWEIVCAATTNKAAEVFGHMSGHEVKTVHKTLGLRIQKDHKTNTAFTIEIDKRHKLRNVLLFIDEASYLDVDLIQMIKKKCLDCKIVYIGDPAQLAPIKKTVSPIFNLGFPTAKLTAIMRQAQGNPIIELSAKFRDVVNGADWFQTELDNHHLVWLPRHEFEAEILKVFSDPDLRGDSARVLAYTNKAVIAFNKGIRGAIQGLSDLQIGDYAIVNNAIHTSSCKLNTDQEVCITHAQPCTQLDVPGRMVVMDSTYEAFLPYHLEDKKQRLKQARANGHWISVAEIEDQWVDLRAAFSCTINKSQGSTYDKVFIDLDDVRKCNSGNQISRLMYVAVSRARYNVYFTGDLAKAARKAA